MEYPEKESAELFEDEIAREGRGIEEEMNVDGSLSEKRE